MSDQGRTWGPGPTSVEGRLLQATMLAVLMVLYVAGYLHSLNWTVFILPAVLIVSMLTSRWPRSIRIDGDTVTFLLTVRAVRLPATDVHRIRRTRLIGNVIVETAKGRFKLPFWLKGLYDLAVELQTLNPALVIDGP